MMGKGRLEAFTDGVIAIIITIMVLELKVPHEAGLAGLQASVPVLLAYVLSFVNVGIFWVNHHHMLHATDRIDGRVLWANLSLLFWLSLVPFVIRWIDEAGFTAWPTAARTSWKSCNRPAISSLCLSQYRSKAIPSTYSNTR